MTPIESMTTPQRTQELLVILSSMGPKDAAERDAMFSRLLRAGVSIDYRDTLPHKTLLMHAIRNDKLPTSYAQQLLEAGANPHAKDASGWSALHYAAFFREDMIPKLLAEKVSVNDHTTSEHETALHMAIFKEQVSGVAALLKAGAHINSPGGTGNQTPLMYSTRNKNDKCLKLLLAEGASIQSVDSRRLHSDMAVPILFDIMNSWKPRLGSNYEPQNRQELMHLVSVMPLRNIEVIPEPRELAEQLFRTLPHNQKLNALYEEYFNHPRPPQAKDLQQLRAAARSSGVGL